MSAPSAGDVAARDAAAHTLWQLVKDDRKLLSPQKDALGVAGVKLIDPLVHLIEAGTETEERELGEGEFEPGQLIAV